MLVRNPPPPLPLSTMLVTFQKCLFYLEYPLNWNNQINLIDSVNAHVWWIFLWFVDISHSVLYDFSVSNVFHYCYKMIKSKLKQHYQAFSKAREYLLTYKLMLRKSCLKLRFFAKKRKFIFFPHYCIFFNLQSVFFQE